MCKLREGHWCNCGGWQSGLGYLLLCHTHSLWSCSGSSRMYYFHLMMESWWACSTLTWQVQKNSIIYSSECMVICYPTDRGSALSVPELSNTYSRSGFSECIYPSAADGELPCSRTPETYVWIFPTRSYKLHTASLPATGISYTIRSATKTGGVFPVYTCGIVAYP